MLKIGIDSSIWANISQTNDSTVRGSVSKWNKLIVYIRLYIGGLLKKTLKTSNTIIHSPSILSSKWVKRLNASDADIVHLHWVQGEMISIADIGRIKKPIVWTLHDMWAFCGAEHCSFDKRWQESYRIGNRPAHESGFDLNRWTWERKRKHWRRPMQIVAPSNWLANCVRESALMSGWPVAKIPNCINTKNWKPLEKHLARKLLGLPNDMYLIMFGTYAANTAYHKGFDLLISSIKHLHNSISKLKLVVLGEILSKNIPDLGYPIHYMGHLDNDNTLQILYSAVDAVIVPSRLETFGQVALEAQACGTPVVAFNIGGLSDIIEHKYTGYLAKAFETKNLAHGIQWVLKKNKSNSLGVRARERVVKNFSNQIVAEQYRSVYKNFLK